MCFNLGSQQLLMKQLIQVVTHFSHVKEDNCSRDTTGFIVSMVMCRQMSLSPSGGNSAAGRCDWVGQSAEDDCNQSGAFHQNSWLSNSVGKSPPEAESAGLSGLLTWFQRSGGMTCMMWETWLPMNLFRQRVFSFIKLRTIVLPVHVNTIEVGMLSACRV